MDKNSPENTLEILNMEYRALKQRNLQLCDNYVKLQTLINRTGKKLLHLNSLMRTGFKRRKTDTGMVREIARHRPQSITTDSQVHLLQQQNHSLRQNNQEQEETNNRLEAILDKTTDFLMQMDTLLQSKTAQTSKHSGLYYHKS